MCAVWSFAPCEDDLPRRPAGHEAVDRKPGCAVQPHRLGLRRAGHRNSACFVPGPVEAVRPWVQDRDAHRRAAFGVLAQSPGAVPGARPPRGAASSRRGRLQARSSPRFPPAIAVRGPRTPRPPLGRCHAGYSSPPGIHHLVLRREQRGVMGHTPPVPCRPPPKLMRPLVSCGWPHHDPAACG